MASVTMICVTPEYKSILFYLFTWTNTAGSGHMATFLPQPLLFRITDGYVVLHYEISLILPLDYVPKHVCAASMLFLGQNLRSRLVSGGSAASHWPVICLVSVFIFIVLGPAHSKGGRWRRWRRRWRSCCWRRICANVSGRNKAIIPTDQGLSSSLDFTVWFLISCVHLQLKFQLHLAP